MIAEALRRRLGREPDLEWAGWFPRASDLCINAARTRPDVVILDVDIPGDDVFQSLRDLVRASPGTRVLMLSGHAGRELVELSVDAGAWGYVLKSDDTDSIIEAVREVARGRFVLRPDSLIEYRR